MQNDQAHAFPDALGDALDNLVADRAVVLVTPPEKNVGLGQPLDREAMFRDSITKAITNGVTTAVNRGKRGRDVLQEAVDHAMRTNPDAVQHFMATSNMSRDTLGVMAERAAVDLGIKLDAEAVIADAGDGA